LDFNADVPGIDRLRLPREHSGPEDRTEIASKDGETRGARGERFRDPKAMRPYGAWGELGKPVSNADQGFRLCPLRVAIEDRQGRFTVGRGPV
jgi:hypothetical protein